MLNTIKPTYSLQSTVQFGRTMARKLTDFQVLQEDVDKYTEKLTVSKALQINFDKCSGGLQTKMFQSQSAVIFCPQMYRNLNKLKELKNGIDTYSRN